MKIKINIINNSEIKDFLLSQDGITNVETICKDGFTNMNIDITNKINPNIVMKYIELFENNHFILFEFDKDDIANTKTLKYVIEDMCCEYCYAGFVMELFENDNIKSVKSNFSFNKPALNIEFVIEYNKEYNEKELIKYLNSKK